MDVKIRILSGRVIEQMDKKPKFSQKLGLENISVFCGERKNEAKEWVLAKKGGTQNE